IFDFRPGSWGHEVLRKVRAQPFAYYLASRSMGTLRQGEEVAAAGATAGRAGQVTPDCRNHRAVHARLQESEGGSRTSAPPAGESQPSSVRNAAAGCVAAARRAGIQHARSAAAARIAG